MNQNTTIKRKSRKQPGFFLDGFGLRSKSVCLMGQSEYFQHEPSPDSWELRYELLASIRAAVLSKKELDGSLL